MARLAVDGGQPVRSSPLPYARQEVSESDIVAVQEVLRGEWLTTGPAVQSFERSFAEAVGAEWAVAVSSGTAALHVAMCSLEIERGDEVVVPAMTFAATANCVVYRGGTPVFADVDPRSLLLDPEAVASVLSPRTRAVIAVDFAGQPCDYQSLRDLAAPRSLALVDDASHALGASYRGRPVGSIAELSTFSLHAVKHITSGEGGVLTGGDPAFRARALSFRNHGFTADHHQRAAEKSWHYEMVELGYNYRLTDFQCALAQSQLGDLPRRLERRRRIAGHYREALSKNEVVRPLEQREEAGHACHLFVILLDTGRLRVGRDEIFRALRAEGIGVNVHYMPVHLHPFYRRRFHTAPGLCPRAEDAYERLLTLPLFPAMTDGDVADVVEGVNKVTAAYSL